MFDIFSDCKSTTLFAKKPYLCDKITRMTFETSVLPCGLRIICAPYHSNVAYCGIAVDAGTRDELPQESGMAHFTEHLCFKGTQRRKAWHIINRMESVGGDLNAYTGKEETIYYCTFMREHYARAIDILLDITLHSTYPQHEMDKEVEVVIDEIESYNDSPSELIYDDFEGMIFQGHPLGRNILGEAERLRQLETKDILQFTHRLYKPERMVLFFYGDITMKQIVREVEKHIYHYPLQIGTESPLPRATPIHTEQPHPIKRITKDTHQAHVMIGAKGYGATDPHHLHLFLLNNLLGGPCMSSRFNLALREHNGLVYSVDSSLITYTDTGLWGVYFGCDAHDVDRCIRLIRNELQKLVDAPLHASQLKAAKRQLQGQIGISWETGENVAIGMGKRFLHYHSTQTCEQLCLRIEDITAQELWDTAQDILSPDRMSILMYV